MRTVPDGRKNESNRSYAHDALITINLARYPQPDGFLFTVSQAPFLDKL